MPRQKSDSRDLGTVHFRQFPFFNPFQVNEQKTNQLFYFFAPPQECVGHGHSFAISSINQFLKYVWIRTQRTTPWTK